MRPCRPFYITPINKWYDIPIIVISDEFMEVSNFAVLFSHRGSNWAIRSTFCFPLIDASRVNCVREGRFI